MKRLSLLLLALGASSPAGAGPLISFLDDRLLLEARAGRVTAWDADDLRTLWSVEGLTSPSLIAVSPDRSRAAVLDAIADRVVLIRAESMSATLFDVPATPVAATFVGDSLFVLSRDGRAITRFDANGAQRTAAVPRDATMMAAHDRGILVYGRASGEAVLLDSDDLSLVAAASLPPFASDLEIDGDLAYLVLPRQSKLIAVSLETLAVVEQRSAGAVPTDLVRANAGTLASAATLAIADPSSKRVWRDEGSQSLPAAIGRGFLRGLLGLGLFSPRSSAFPTGVDRVFVSRGSLWAFDSSTGSLYRTSGSAVSRVAEGLHWGGFAVGAEAVFVAMESGPERLPLD